MLGTRRLGPQMRQVLCLALSDIGMQIIPKIRTPALLCIPMIGVSIARASLMGNPYIILASCISAHRNGV
jgi:maltose/moltooligosaccharide transporter